MNDSGQSNGNNSSLFTITISRSVPGKGGSLPDQNLFFYKDKMVSSIKALWQEKQSVIEYSDIKDISFGKSWNYFWLKNDLHIITKDNKDHKFSGISTNDAKKAQDIINSYLHKA